MGGDVYKLIALLAVVVGVGAVAYYLRSNRCGQKPGIISEDINGSGDNWSADLGRAFQLLNRRFFARWAKSKTLSPIRSWISRCSPI
jgi:hypothetical protein